MKNETIIKLLNLTSDEKQLGIFLSDDDELWIGIWNRPDNFTGEYKDWWDNKQLSIHSHSHYKNGELHGEYKSWYSNGTLYRYELWENGVMIKNYIGGFS